MLLDISKISVAHGEVKVLDSLSITADGGEVVAILGPNGAGKTTLLRTVSGLLPVLSGSIAFDGGAIHNHRPHQVARMGVAHVPEGRGLLPELTVTENLRLGTYARGRDKDGSDFDRIYRLFPVLETRGQQQAGMLSGGEQQMLAIARSLLARPKLLLIDELSLGLAPKIARELLSLLRDLAKDGLGILLVEQNVQQTLKVADRVYVMVNGRITFAGTPVELAAQGEIMRLYMGMD
ncbi:branched-chain amino acid transport system ATP-binding protein [Rhodoligotrophos appendicifer]|uniref:ABC transporter ATP-binding protein n=1 Tax=Rhodoligotrophos appendicifer TaxID=987056 RepID=UPI0011856BD7|nr:ABC transporter ATP-binding protein [Rhodoligotrophos appendicifer]